MEAFLIKALQLMLSLSILVVFHEYGHFIVSRMFGIRVERFYMFFDYKFSLLSFKRESKSLVVKVCEKLKFNIPMWASKPSDTEFGMGWIPFGGYVKISGMIDESMDREQMALPPQPWEFRSKPAWQRLLVMIAGVVFNFILAIIIYAGIVLHWGETYLPFENAKAGMEFSQPALDAGFQDGDIILAADGEKLDYYSNKTLHKIIEADVVTVNRNGQEVAVEIPENLMLDIMEQETFLTAYRLPNVIDSVVVGMGAHGAGLMQGDYVLSVNGVSTPTFDEFKSAVTECKSQSVDIEYVRDDKTMTASVMTDSLGMVGISFMQDARALNIAYDFVHVDYNLWQSIPRGVEMGVNQLTNYVSDFQYVFTKQGAQSLGGFGSIGSLFAAQWDWYSFWSMTAFLSVILAFMNILPIPALDGGHVLFLIYEVVTRRKPSDKFMEWAQMIGMFLLFALLIYANANDIVRFLF